MTRLRESGPARLTASVVAGTAVGLASGALGGSVISTAVAALIGIAVTALSFLASGVAVLWRMSPTETREHSTREDFTPIVDEAVVIVTTLAGLVAVITLFALTYSTSEPFGAAMGLLAVTGVWGMIHVMYTARYAHQYYSEPEGGIDFNTDDPPRYADFFYFSFNLGMTYQVSDTNVSTTALRSMILRHCLLSFFFGAVIIAATINLVAGIFT